MFFHPVPTDHEHMDMLRWKFGGPNRDMSIEKYIEIMKLTPNEVRDAIKEFKNVHPNWRDTFSRR